MHCYKCERSIETAKGADKFPVYNMKMKSYNPQEGVVIECPHCGCLIVVTHITPEDLDSNNIILEAIN